MGQNSSSEGGAGIINYETDSMNLWPNGQGAGYNLTKSARNHSLS